MIENVIHFYENYDEEGRLFRDNAHLPEYLTTIRYFDRLFTSGSHILDACAGTGRYSFYLAEKGHIVTTCDLVEHNVDIIKSKPNANKLADIAICNTLDLLRFENNSFDVVLCMGALYHLSSNDLQKKAISECVRVCKSGGIVVLAYIVSNTNEQNKISYDMYEDVFYSSTSHEIEEIAVKCGLTKMYNISTDGIAKNTEINLTELNDEDFQIHMENHYLSCEDDSIVRMGGHCLWIGKKTVNITV